MGKTRVVERFGREEYDWFLHLDLSEEGTRGHFEGDISADGLLRELSDGHPGFRAVRGRSLLLLDNVHMCDDARAAIKPLVADGRCDVIACGTLLGPRGLRASGNGRLFWRRRWVKGAGRDCFGFGGEPPVRVTPLGYEQVVDMYPMDFEEYLWALGCSDDLTSEVRRRIEQRVPFPEEELDALTALYDRYSATGGMPEVVSASLEGPGRAAGALEDVRDGWLRFVDLRAPSS